MVHGGLSCLKVLLKDAYAAAKTYEEKAAFRRDWAKEQYEHHVKSRSQVTSLKKEDVAGGKHLALARIAWLEGGGPAGMRAACQLALKCLELGKPWYTNCPFTMRKKFMYLETGFQETFTKACCWNEDTRLFVFCKETWCGPCSA